MIVATTAQAQAIMQEFARATGLSDASREPRRYLWTDAFAVCNFLELYRQTRDETYLQTARSLVDQVHVVLGRYSDGDARSGWISGLDEQAGYAHPTAGGLRIGKRLPERRADERFDDRLEWERDGQYFHYLTKWMQALSRVAAVTGDGNFQRWALELARAAHAGFTRGGVADEPRRMYWKMSIDLSRPLVASMGHHDPLDGLLTYQELVANSGRYGSVSGDIDLHREIADCQAMCMGRSWATDDPLGTGGLLVDTFLLAQIMLSSEVSGPLQLASLLADCEAGLEAFMHSRTLDHNAAHRLAFREFGLSIGLRALARLEHLVDGSPGRFSQGGELREQLRRLAQFSPLSDIIENFWLQAAHQRSASWRDHLDINSVMLATSLAPDGYLAIRPGNAGRE